MANSFIFVVCQSGAEAACKAELAVHHPELRLAFSRPGFLTMKCEADWPEAFQLRSTFARTAGWSIGHQQDPSANGLISHLLQMEKLAEADHLHVWQRDLALPGANGFEPGPGELVNLLSQQIGDRLDSVGRTKKLNRNALTDDKVFDVIIVEPGWWWFGYHVANRPANRWPGGVPPTDFSREVINRAYFKLREALLWSGIHIQSGDVCAEIGASPGGACQLLLEKGARVIAVDPAPLDPAIAEHPNLTFLQGRGREIRKREYREVRWLVVDVNSPPNYTLDVVEDIVGSRHVRQLAGMILTLKLSDYQMAGEIPNWIDRVKRLGFQWVRTRQLAFNRREICLVAVRDRYALRRSRRPKKS